MQIRFQGVYHYMPLDYDKQPDKAVFQTDRFGLGKNFYATGNDAVCLSTAQEELEITQGFRNQAFLAHQNGEVPAETRQRAEDDLESTELRHQGLKESLSAKAEDYQGDSKARCEFLANREWFQWVGQPVTGRDILNALREAQRNAVVVPAVGMLKRLPSTRLVFPDDIAARIYKAKSPDRQADPNYEDLARQLMANQSPKERKDGLLEAKELWWQPRKPTEAELLADQAIRVAHRAYDQAQEGIKLALSEFVDAGLVSEGEKSNWPNGKSPAFSLTGLGRKYLK